MRVGLGSLSLTTQSRLLNERSGVAVLDVHRYQEGVVDSSSATIDYHYAYVDNMGVFGQNDNVVTSALDEAKGAFEGQGLLLHEMEVVWNGADTLGVAVGTRGLCSARTSKRLRILRRAIGGFLALSFSTGKCVEMLLGHCTYAALTCLILLCIFHSACIFVQAVSEEAVRIWPSVRKEFRHFRGLLPLCQSDWARQWSPYATQTDASETGFGICSSERCCGGLAQQSAELRKDGWPQLTMLVCCGSTFAAVLISRPGRWQAGRSERGKRCSMGGTLRAVSSGGCAAVQSVA